MVELTARQQEILDFLLDIAMEQGYPPTMREIAATFGFPRPTQRRRTSKRSRKGGDSSRSTAAAASLSAMSRSPPSNRSTLMPQTQPVRVPVLGRVAAGEPHMARSTQRRLCWSIRSLRRGVVRTSLAWSLAASR